jgi:hypothetical protein
MNDPNKKSLINVKKSTIVEKKTKSKDKEKKEKVSYTKTIMLH